jgi:hypothetical protein
MWCQIVMALKMKADGCFETFYLCTILEGFTLHKTVCFFLRIVFWIVVHKGITAGHIANYVICAMYSRSIYWCH